MNNLKSIIQERDFSVLLPLATTDYFTSADIHNTVKNEMGLIKFFTEKFSKDEPEVLHSVIHYDIAFVTELINNQNVTTETLDMLIDTNHPMLSVYAKTLRENFSADNS